MWRDEVTILSAAFSDDPLRRLSEAYVHLLLLPTDTIARVRVDPVMARLRDTIAELTGYDAEAVQVTFETFVAGRPR